MEMVMNILAFWQVEKYILQIILDKYFTQVFIHNAYEYYVSVWTNKWRYYISVDQINAPWKASIL